VTVRALFLGEGTSDSGIIPQIETLAANHGIDIAITDPDLARLPKPPGRAVSEKLRAIIEMDGRYDLIIIHRDADRDGRAARLAEITDAVKAHASGTPHAAVIPIRMTEAWLLLDERELRIVAGNPNGRVRLDLPGPRKVESIPDPKSLLKQKLALASELSGRKLEKFQGRFPHHRRLLLERIHPAGSITKVPSWCDFVADLTSALVVAASAS
jgi:hypothetical protein